MNESELTKEKIVEALIAAASILELAALHVRERNHSPKVLMNFAERERIRADSAFRKAIGAHCDKCGGNTENVVGS